MKVLIATDRFHRINSEIVFTLGYCGYKVTIREVSTSYPVNQVPHYNPSHTKVEDKDSASDIPGFEDISEDDETSNYHKDQEVVEETPAGQFNIRRENEKGSTSSYDSHQHATSRSKTRTISFSQNGYSVELLKMAQHLRTVEKVLIMKSQHYSLNHPRVLKC